MIFAKCGICVGEKYFLFYFTVILLKYISVLICCVKDKASGTIPSFFGFVASIFLFCSDNDMSANTYVLCHFPAEPWLTCLCCFLPLLVTEENF